MYQIQFINFKLYHHGWDLFVYISQHLPLPASGSLGIFPVFGVFGFVSLPSEMDSSI